MVVRGGYVAAIRAAQYGKSVCVFEERKLGGTCLNRGCIPTKALLHISDTFKMLSHIEELGITAENISFDMGKINQRKNGIVDKLVKGIEFIFKKRNIEIFTGHACLKDKNHISVQIDGEEKIVESENIILATGSEPLVLPFFNYDGEKVITSNEALDLVDLPKDMVIIGGGVVGCEFANIFSDLGVQVTIVELMDDILLTEDSEIRKRLKMNFKKRKIKILTKTKVENIEINDKVSLSLDNGKILEAEKVLLAVGRKLNTKELGYEECGIEYEKNAIKVNEKMQTNIENIYAIGDITGKQLLAHVASFQGLIAVDNILGKESVMEYDAVPGCIYTNPEIGSFGLTEDAVIESGKEYNVGKFPFAALGKAMCINETEGLVKIISDKDGYILGAHIIGPHATDLIMELLVAKRNKLKVDDVAHTIHPHPTLSEGVLEATEAIFGKSIHQI